MRGCCLCLALAPIVFFAAASDAAAAKPRTRTEFAAAIGQVKADMREDEVFALLGRPDNVWHAQDMAQDYLSDWTYAEKEKSWTREQSPFHGSVNEVWRYGCSGRWSFATLGQVHFNSRGQVNEVVGTGRPPPEGYFDERVLRHLLEVLSGVVCAPYPKPYYQPRRIIESVNRLQPLGKEKALAAIDELYRVMRPDPFEDDTSLCFMLRTLFETQEDTAHLAMSTPAISKTFLKTAPQIRRYPIVLVDDIPLLVLEDDTGFVVRTGVPVGNVRAAHIAHYRKHGTIRARPLTPGAVPWNAVETFPPGLSPRKPLEEQVLRLLDTVYRLEPGEIGELLPFPRNEEQSGQRQKIIDKASSLKIRWDAPTNRYTFLDGSTLPELPPKDYRRDVWKPASPDLDLVLVVERTGPSTVSITLRESLGRPLPRPKMVLRMFDIESKAKNLIEFKVDDPTHLPPTAYKENTLRGSRAGASWTGQIVDLEDGARVQVEYSLAGKVQLSPIYKP